MSIATKSLTSPVMQSSTPVYFFGCDVGGWHTRRKDALAICNWSGGAFKDHHVEHGRLFYPVPENGNLIRNIRNAINASAKVIVAIDAALAWPRDFLRLAISCPKASHLLNCDADGRQIQNRYLFRETERFIKKQVRKKKDPFSAPGDSFGSPSSKAQALVANLRVQFPDVYRPPFDKWSIEKARQTQMTIIEVYPAASEASRTFQDLRWSQADAPYIDLPATDENDAKRCASTAICYAATVGLLPEYKCLPKIWLPDETGDEYDSKKIAKEGWIFAPKIEVPKEPVS